MALLHVNYHSDVLDLNVEMDVILPEETLGQIGMTGTAGQTYPTLYLLHGMSDDHTIWQRRTSIERYAARYNLAVVMPSADLSWYTDMYRGPKYFTFLTRELPKICRGMFPRMSDRREDTFIAGLSMGGYGALKAALRADDVYSQCAALSAAADVALWARTAREDRKTYWEDVFGPAEQVEGSINDIFAAARELKASGRPLPRVYMWCGTEDSLFNQNERMRDCLREQGYDLTWEQSPGGHSWDCWDDKIQTVLQWLPLEGGKK